MHIFHKWSHWGQPHHTDFGQALVQYRTCTKCGIVTARILEEGGRNLQAGDACMSYASAAFPPKLVSGQTADELLRNLCMNRKTSQTISRDQLEPKRNIPDDRPPGM